VCPGLSAFPQTGRKDDNWSTHTFTNAESFQLNHLLSLKDNSYLGIKSICTIYVANKTSLRHDMTKWGLPSNFENSRFPNHWDEHLVTFLVVSMCFFPLWCPNPQIWGQNTVSDVHFNDTLTFIAVHSVRRFGVQSSFSHTWSQFTAEKHQGLVHALSSLSWMT
jgi:hypothetical protein